MQPTCMPALLPSGSIFSTITEVQSRFGSTLPGSRGMLGTLRQNDLATSSATWRRCGVVGSAVARVAAEASASVPRIRLDRMIRKIVLLACRIGVLKPLLFGG